MLFVQTLLGGGYTIDCPGILLHREFTAAGKCRLQKEVTCIGNQIYPVLLGLPVLMAEQTFLKSLPHAIFSSFLFLRYVDNRLILAPSHILQQSQIKKFCLRDFYEGIQLESVEDHQWLGFTIGAPARTATFNLPTKPRSGPLLVQDPVSWQLPAFSLEQPSSANTPGPKSQLGLKLKRCRKAMYRRVSQETVYLCRGWIERCPL